jgi:hypothetical protein
LKLELKHLAGYLPYRLKIKTEYGCDTMMTLNEWSINGDFEQSYCYETEDTTDFKPILRPLSDLTKEIEVNGEKFVPNYILNTRFRASSKDLVPYKYDNYNLELDVETKDYSQKIDLFDGFLIVQQLLEWHFDIYGLIKAELAIDINTLQ